MEKLNIFIPIYFYTITYVLNFHLKKLFRNPKSFSHKFIKKLLKNEKNILYAS